MAAARVLIRPERPGDAEAIRAVHDAAFREPDEGRIVDEVRPTAAFVPELSFVAEDDDCRIVGHVLMSRARLERRDAPPLSILVLGPIGVLPSHQRRGVGTALMRAVIGGAVGRAEPLIALLGHPTYYPRFGFEPARRLGLEPPQPWPDADWQVLRLPPWTADYRGVVHYPEAFLAG